MSEFPVSSVLIRPSPRRTRSSRALRWLAVAMIAFGALALADGIVTLVWQEPISALVGKFRQDHLKGQLRAVEAVRPDVAEQHALAGISGERNRIAYLAAQLQHRARNGSPIGRIEIPSIGASYVMVYGTDTSDLESGPGFFTETTFPGIDGTTLISGHRTTYLAPFRHIDSLRAGQKIELRMPYALFTYTVVGHRVVSPSDVRAATSQVGYSRVVLSACTPLFSAAKRLLVFGRLTRAVPVGPARHLTEGQLPQPLDYPLQPPPAHELPAVLKSLGPYYVAPAA